MKDCAHTSEMTDTELLVCVTCRRAAREPEAETRDGAALYASLMARAHPDGLRVTPTKCLQNCEHGCTVALRGGGSKWTYVFANVVPDEHADMLLAGAAQYHATPDGLIPWRQRPEHFKRNCVARLPPLTSSQIQQDR